MSSPRDLAGPALLLVLLATAAQAQDAATPASDAAAMATPPRPAVMFNRWQEDWSVLADAAVPREPLDGLKYLPLGAGDPQTYLSLGANLRERFEGVDAPSFGVGGAHPEDYVISRLEVDADLRLKSQVQVFVQLQSDYAPWKKVLTPVDQDRLDVEQAFVAVTEPVDGGSLTVRVGRQQIAFDLQRFISVRDGPNVRQSYDAAWAEYLRGPWRLTAFYSQPVQARDLRAFDDDSSGRLTYAGARLERSLPGKTRLSVAAARFTQDQAHFLSARGDERRDIVDVHAAGAPGAWDWDVEAMNQTGSIGPDRIEAWAVGSLAGYTFQQRAWRPRLGLQVDAASGDRNPGDHVLGTFNPLFPNGYYLDLSGLTGFVNFVHVKPSLTLHPCNRLTLLLAAAGLWRETTADAVYTQPDIPVARTAGRGDPFTAVYGELRVDWNVNEHVAAALEADRYVVGQTIRAAGGHDADYLGVELRYGW
jgi:alginate export protein